MADNEDESNMSRTTTEQDCVTGSQECVFEVSLSGNSALSLTDLESQSTATDQECVETIAPEVTETRGFPEYFQRCTKDAEQAEKEGQVGSQFMGNGLLENNIITSFVEPAENETTTVAEYSTVNTDFVESISNATTTIIYVQPDGSFVEGTGLTADEQQQLVEQLAKQQLVQLTENEAVRIFEQNQGPKPVPTESHYVHSGTLAPHELQQVIEQVSKSQQSAVHAEQRNVTNVTPKVLDLTVTGQLPSGTTIDQGGPSTPRGQLEPVCAQPLTIMQNASQQLKNVAKQVALQQSQNGSRLVPKKQMETIRIQVQMPSNQEVKERSIPHIVIPQQTSLAVSQPLGNISTGGTNPQIIHITPVVGQQQYYLQNPGDPPIQLLLQTSTPVVNSLVPVTHKIPIQTTVNGAAVRPPVAAPAAAAPPAPAIVEKERKKGKSKPKKPQKIKTRSGRVSRPPKYKVKDYKFIKTEDLADGRQSDSDDYSEISEEEEDGEDGKKTSAMNFNLNHRAFKCETCEKAYIGHGGLSRHYKLNPSHGEQQPSFTPVTVINQPAGLVAVTPSQQGLVQPPGKDVHPGGGCTVKTVDPIPPHLEKTGTVASLSSPTPETAGAQEAPNPAKPGQSRGPGRPKGPGRPAQPKVAGRPVKRGRPGRPPKRLGVSMEQQIQRRRVLLKEVIQQCDNEELMEIVLPRLAKVMTVWEFLLMKVEKGRPSKPQFSDVYREFEQLHSQVKKMAQDYLSCPQHTLLDVHNVEVSRSLGIMDQVKSKTLQSNVTLQNPAGDSVSTKNVRYIENSKMLPPAKRFKMESRPVEAGRFQVNGVEKVTEQAPTNSESSINEVNEAQTEISAVMEDKGAVLETLKSPLGMQQSTEEPKASLSEHHPQTGTVTLKALEVLSTPEINVTPPEPVQDCLPNQGTETDDPVEVEGDMEIGNELALPEISQIDQGVPNIEISEVLNNSDIVEQMQELEQALSTDSVQPEHEQSTQEPEPKLPEAGPDMGQESSLSHTISLAHSVEFQVSQVSQEAGQVYIQTEDGLIMHQTGSNLAAEDIVIINSPDGTTMHIHAPEGVPMETVHALLGIETQEQT